MVMFHSCLMLFVFFCCQRRVSQLFTSFGLLRGKLVVLLSTRVSVIVIVMVMAPGWWNLMEPGDETGPNFETFNVYRSGQETKVWGLEMDTLRCHQTWLAGKYTTYIGDFPIETQNFEWICKCHVWLPAGKHHSQEGRWISPVSRGKMNPKTPQLGSLLQFRGFRMCCGYQCAWLSGTWRSS